MTASYAKHYSTRETPQDQPIPGRAMVANQAGGFTFAVDDWTRLDRFLVLGAEGGTYYAGERALTVAGAECMRRCLATDADRAVRAVVEASEGGRAPKNAPAVFALAVAAGTGHLGAVAAHRGLERTCRTPTDLFAFVAAVEGLRGWGRGLKRLVAGWYAGMPADRLAYLTTKYQQRDGWSHRDLLRLAHPTAPTPAHDAVYRWVVAGAAGSSARTVARKAGPTSTYAPTEDLPTIIAAFEQAKVAPDAATVCRLVRDHGLVREHVPSRWLNHPEVWDALLERMPLHALVRNLAKMTAVGLLKPLSDAARTVRDRLGDADHLRRARLHPVAILLAAGVYGQGRGDKGNLAWTPVPTVVDALDGAFYRAFAHVEPAGKRRLLALDVSGSMAGTQVAGSPVTCREAAAALALVVARTEPDHHIMAFAAPAQARASMVALGGGLWGSRGSLGHGLGGMHGGGDPDLVPLDLSGCSRIADAMAAAGRIPMGGTDCSLPMRVAQREGWQVDSFEVYTDNETWAGPVHPCQALVAYRQATGIPAKLVVQALTATEFTIADPADAGTLDVVGLDAAAPALVADFVRGGPPPTPSLAQTPGTLP